MDLLKKILMITLLFSPTDAFMMFKLVRVNCQLLKRQTGRAIAPHMSFVTENESRLIDRSVSILSDNAINELLNFMKFYHMTNDTSSTILYIISY